MSRHPLSRTRSAVIAFVVFALLLAPAGAAAAQGNDIQSLYAALSAPNNQFPEVALTVDGQPVPGILLARALAVGQANAAAAGVPFDRTAAIDIEIHRLVLKEAVARRIAQRGYTVSDAEITAFLTQQAQDINSHAPNEWSALLSANGMANIQDYVNNRVIRDTARQMLAAQEMFADLQSNDPTFDPNTWVDGLAQSVVVQLNFTP